jgi:hypothetical protein
MFMRQSSRHEIREEFAVSQRSAAIAYTRDFGLSMAAYVVVLIISVSLLDKVDQPVKTLIALVPLVPAGFALKAYLRFLTRMDELGRRIQLEALAFGFGAAGMLTFAYGFLENAGFPQLSYTWVFPLMIALWGIGGAIATRRYR